MVAPWGGAVTYAPAVGGFTVTAATAPSAQICTLITAKFANSAKFTVPAATCTPITYNANK